MGRKKQKKTVEFRYYDMPKGKSILPLIGVEWIRPYGRGFGNYHFHNYTEIGLCYFGKGTTWLNDETGYEFTGGSIVIIPPNITHTMLTDKDSLAYWEWFYIDIPTLLEEMKCLETRRLKIPDILALLHKEALFFHVDDYPKIGRIMREIRDECEEQTFLYEQKIKILVQEIIVEIFRMTVEKSKGDIEKSLNPVNIIQPAFDYMKKHYCEEIKIKMLADVCGMSESHFRRVFTEYMSMTPNSYINVVRIRKACQLLVETELSTNDIAYKVGFVDTSTFHRNFKKILEMTPKQWKNSQKDYGKQKQYFNITALKGW